MTTATLFAQLRTQLADAQRPGLAGVRALEGAAQTVAALALFVAFVIGFFMAAAFAAAGRADRRIEAEEGEVDPRLRIVREPVWFWRATT